MPQSLAQVWLHLVFSTKERYPFLGSPEFREEVHRYLKAAAIGMDCPTRIVNGTADHVHVLCSLSRTISISDLVKGLKEPSSKSIKRNHRGMLAKFHWQVGYAAFSVSSSQVETVERYIANQERHHRRVGFKEELLKFLDRYQIEYDEAHLWD